MPATAFKKSVLVEVSHSKQYIRWPSFQAHGIVKRQRSNRSFKTESEQGADTSAGETVWTGIAHVPVEIATTSPSEKLQHGDPGHPMWWQYVFLLVWYLMFDHLKF